ncbi:hypothetical protein GCM10020001_101790 [Nonomuraea salmonea]
MVFPQGRPGEAVGERDDEVAELGGLLDGEGQVECGQDGRQPVEVVGVELDAGPAVLRGGSVTRAKPGGRRVWIWAAVPWMCRMTWCR